MQECVTQETPKYRLSSHTGVEDGNWMSHTVNADHSIIFMCLHYITMTSYSLIVFNMCTSTESILFSFPVYISSVVLHWKSSLSWRQKWAAVPVPEGYEFGTNSSAQTDYSLAQDIALYRVILTCNKRRKPPYIL